MDLEDPEYLEAARFFDLVDLGSLHGSESLEEISGSPARRGGYETDMIARAERAWMTPLGDLSCEQVRLLIGQKMGLEWLGGPALEFAERYPMAVITNYDGEMGLLCLRAARELSQHFGPTFSAWLAGDFSWMDRAFAWDETGALHDEARSLLASARALVQRH